MIVFESSRTQYNHLGASCSNIGRIRTKENIAVGTLLIGTLPSSLGGFLILFEYKLNTFWEPTLIVFESESLKNSQGH